MSSCGARGDRGSRGGRGQTNGQGVRQRRRDGSGRGEVRDIVTVAGDPRRSPATLALPVGATESEAATIAAAEDG